MLVLVHCNDHLLINTYVQVYKPFVKNLWRKSLKPVFARAGAEDIQSVHIFFS